MATISSTLSFQDQMSAKMESIARKLDLTATEAKIAKANLDQLENAQKQWKITLDQLEKAEVKDKNAIANAREEYLKALREYDNGVLKVQKYESQLAQLEQQQKRNTQGFESMAGKIVTLSAAFQLFNQAKAFISGINAKINEFTEYSKTQMQAEDQLSIITKQRIGLEDEEVRSLYGLAAAQQRVGIVGDEAVIKGMAGVAAFTKQKSSIEALTPAMNNLAVKTFGYNVTAENMDNISRALGRAMQGDIGQLSRMGVKIDDVTKKRLISLKEEERAVELAKIIKNVTGDMNEAFAKTPYGKLAQANNRLGDSYEKLGNLLVPFQAKFAEVWSTIVEKVVNNLDKIVPLLLAALTVISAAFIATGVQAVAAAIKSGAAWATALLPLTIGLTILGAFMALLDKVGISFEQQAENFLISMNWVITAIKNVGIALENTWNGAVDFVSNFKSNAQLILVDFFKWVTDSLLDVARLFDRVFHTGVADSIQKVSNDLETQRNKLKTNIDNNTHTPKAYLDNDIWTNQAKAEEQMKKLKGTLNNTRSLLGATGGLNLDDYAENGALKTKQQGDITIADDDIELLQDLATRDFAQYYQQLTPNLTIPSMVIHETADVNEVIGAVTNSITGFVRSSTYNTNTGSQAILPA